MNVKHMASSQTLVSVVVVARNAISTIGNCIRSIETQNQIDRDRFEIILVDDGSTDGTVDLAKKNCDTIRVFNNHCRSISANRNIGWRAARGRYVAFIDADCVAGSNWLVELLQVLEDNSQDDQAVAVGGPNCPPKNVSRFYDCLAIVLDTVIGSGGSTQGKVHKKHQEVPHLPGLNVLFKKDALEAVDGYDEAFALVGEDADLCKRLIDQGYTLHYTPNAKVDHFQRNTLKSWASNMCSYGRGRRYLIRRHPGMKSLPYWTSCLALLLLPLYSLTILICSVYLAIKNKCIANVGKIFAIFHCTHLPFAWGMIIGGFERGDTDLAKRRWHDKRLFLMALKNAGNKGDEAIVVSAMNRLSQEQNTRTCLFGFGPSGADIRGMPATSTAQMRVINSVLAADSGSRTTGSGALFSFFGLGALCRRNTCLVVCGGQWFHDLSLAKHILIVGLFSVARLFGATTGLLGVGVGPLKRSFSRWLMRLAFSNRSYLMVRDEKSRDLLLACGLRSVVIGADLAFELPRPEKKPARNEKMRPRLGICPCAWGSFDNLYERDRGHVSDTVREFAAITRTVALRGCDIVFLPSMNPEDHEFAGKIINESGAAENCFLTDTREMTAVEFQSEVADLDCLLSMRLHPLIFAFNVSTPFVALNYADKVAQFITQTNRKEFLIDIQSADWSTNTLQAIESALEVETSANVLQEKFQSTLDDCYRQFTKWLAI